MVFKHDDKTYERSHFWPSVSGVGSLLSCEVEIIAVIIHSLKDPLVGGDGRKLMLTGSTGSEDRKCQEIMEASHHTDQLWLCEIGLNKELETTFNDRFCTLRILLKWPPLL